MGVRFSIVYPTRHRPAFVRQALRVLETQGYDDFEVVVSDNYVDPALSCEQICRDSSVANLKYVHPPRPLGMVENWNHALEFATGEYLLYLTDKMFVLPGALRRVESAIDSAGGPEIVSWTSDTYIPASNADYLGEGSYFRASSGIRSGLYLHFSPADELDRRGRAGVSRGEQSPADYSRGKLVFGAYRRELVQRIVDRYGDLFHNINPDYTSMVLGLTQARDAIEMSASCVVSINTDISNGQLCDTDDAVALAFLDSLAGGAKSLLPNMLVPGLYASLHNWVAHDLLTLRTTFGLKFEFDTSNWLVYCSEDIHRPERRWSAPRAEAEQTGILAAAFESLDPAVREPVEARVVARAASRRATVETVAERSRRLLGHLGRRLGRRAWRRLAPSRSAAAPSIHAAVERRTRR